MTDYAAVAASLRACTDPQKRHAADVIEELSGALSKGNADAFIAGFRAAQRLAYEVVVVHTDGDSPFDGTIARMADAIDRMPLPSAPETK